MKLCKITIEMIGDESYYTLKVKTPTKASSYWGDNKTQYRTIIRAENKDRFLTQVGEFIDELKGVMEGRV